MTHPKPKRAKRCRHSDIYSLGLAAVPNVGSCAFWCMACGALRLDGKWRLPENAGGK